MIELLGNIRRNVRGTAVIELAIALPVLMILALGATDFISAFGRKMALQQYAQAGANFVAANGEKTPTATEVKAEVVATSGLPDANVTITQWTECNQAKVLTFRLCPNIADIKANYMRIAVADTYEPMLNIEGIADFVGQTNLKASVVIRVP